MEQAHVNLAMVGGQRGQLDKDWHSDSIRRDVEEFHRRKRIAMHRLEQPTPDRVRARAI